VKGVRWKGIRIVIGMEDRDFCGSREQSRFTERANGRSASDSSRRIVVSVPNHPATPPTTPTLGDRMELFLDFASFCTACHLTLGHVAS
jgi:hypothetical protein